MRTLTASNREVELIDFIAFAKNYENQRIFTRVHQHIDTSAAGNLLLHEGRPNDRLGRCSGQPAPLERGLSLRSADARRWALNLLPVHRATLWEIALLRQARAIGTGLSLRSADASNHEQRRSSPEQPRVCAGI